MGTPYLPTDELDQVPGGPAGEDTTRVHRGFAFLGYAASILIVV